MATQKDMGLSLSRNSRKQWEFLLSWMKRFCLAELFTSSPLSKTLAKLLEMARRLTLNRKLNKNTRSLKMKRPHIKRKRKEKWGRNLMILPIGIVCSSIPTPFLREFLESLKLLNLRSSCLKTLRLKLPWQKLKLYKKQRTGWKRRA